jgi:hypothetical protein
MALPRFLVRGLRKAKAELALGVLCYNLKRLINILGVPAAPVVGNLACGDHRTSLTAKKA